MSLRGSSDPAFDSRPAFRVCREEYRKIGILGFAGVEALRAMFPSIVLRPRCSASWPVLTRRTIARFIGSGMCKAWFAGLFTSRCVPFVVGRPRCSASWPVRTRRIISRSTLSFTLPLCATTCALVTGCRKLRICRSCSSSMVVVFIVVVHMSIPMVLLFSRPSRFTTCSCTCGSMPLVCLSSWFPCRGAEAVSHGSDLFRTKVFSVLPDKVVDVPVAQVVQFILSLRRGFVSRSRLLLDQEILQLLDTVIDFPVAQVVQVLPRHCAEAVPMVPDCSFDHGHAQLQYTMADVPVV